MRRAALLLSISVLLLPGCKKKPERVGNETCAAFARPPGSADVKLVRHFDGLAFTDSVALEWTPGASGWWYVVEQDGRIYRFADEPGVTSADLVLDITADVVRGFETGLLGVAFHPDFADNGHLYVNYTTEVDGPLTSRISRFTSTDGGAGFDPASELVVFSIEQPFPNHNAGHLAFGPDGLLYFGLGDGGAGGDPLDAGQDLDTHLGKMLRIDVDGGTPYSIPPDNPFADGGGLPEIYAWGLRNPWRFSFDSHTGELWLGDVGQDEWEEVSRIERGGNYGWRVTEGKRCFDPATGCDKSGLVEPVAVYANPGQASVVGGIVYRGAGIEGLAGTYLFSDFYSGEVFAVTYDTVDGSSGRTVILEEPGRALAHWVEGPDGEAWTIDFGGEIFRLEQRGEGVQSEAPALLSQTGCTDPADVTEPAPGVLAYDVAHPFWSDGADKRRWLAIPDGTTITVADDGDWDLPVGSVLVKEFHRDGRLETRLLVRHDDGDWAGYTYQWREDGSDAELLPAGATLHRSGAPWPIPSRAGCVQCHTEAAGGSLGLETRQLAAQLPELVDLGLVTGIDEPDEVSALPGVTGAGSTESRARAYLHVNCSGCHRPDGGARTDLDLRLSATSDEALGLCVRPEHGDLGVGQARIVRGGDPDRSLLWLRMTRRDASQMPPIGSNVVDDQGAALIAEWIEQLPACE